ncbi:sensor histidine kinase [Salinadaptatus halalkaliphilus]|uniref:sensor histidine kinase n=1 Tax=Salinadaptatus halalkaliphilus TaxID=2419781 RepID=UPI001C2BE5C7|nr:ATP-binding protein [Salinadaptatus halalkaliphilus]
MPASDAETSVALSSLLERLPDAVLVLDDQGRIQYATGAVERHLDVAPADLVGNTAFEYVAAIDRDRVRRSFDALVTGPDAASRRIEFRRRDDESVWLEAAGVDTPDSSSETHVITIREITAHKSREHDLERLHDAANDLYSAHSIEECYQITIDTAVTILGFDWCTLAAPASDDDVFEIVAISEHGPVEVGDRPFGTDEGVAGHVFQTKDPEITDDARQSDRGKPAKETIRSALTVPIGEWGIFQAVATECDQFDETDRNRVELLGTTMLTAIERIKRRQALERQNERLDNFVRFVTHDLHTPLTTATGYLELVDETIDDELTELEHVRDAHDRIETIIDQLSTWARGGDMRRSETPIKLEAAVERAWATVAPTAATLEVDTDCTIAADRNCLQHVLENFLGNAIDHGGKDVTVRATDLENGFAIEDDGPGIPEDKREDILEPGVTSNPTGTGLGLAIVDEIADAHGWELTITESSDGGARFEITGVEFPDD